MKQKKMATLKELEKEMILAALERNKMNKCAAARDELALAVRIRAATFPTSAAEI